MLSEEFKNFFKGLAQFLGYSVLLTLAVVFFIPTLGHSWKLYKYAYDHLVP